MQLEWWVYGTQLIVLFMNTIPLIPQSKNFICSSEVRKFLIKNQEYCNSFIVSPEKVIELKESRWTLYPPLSQIMFHQVQGLTLLYFHIVGMSSVVGAINFIVTLFNIRAKGMSLTKMPLFA
ncbi:hypothetical protein X798_02004, partial [Onchocerca flexuosa]